ncbi:MAG TPA: ABC transporter permease [Blastocatellia bacterium]|nr:ABC transporter permease [Blastocatellia bacterium]
MRNLWKDIKYGVRTLAKKPGFTVVALLTLALGIGANTAIFSVINTVLLRPLPFKDPSRLVAVASTNPEAGKGAGGGVSPADFRDWQQQSRSFESLAIYSGTGISLHSEEHPESLPGARVASDFFQTFGVEPALGRVFTPEEGYLGGPKALILSHRLWQRRFGGDPSVIGQTIRTDEGISTIVGVMPNDFKVPVYAEAWVPLPRDSTEMNLRANRYFLAAGRLKEGETLETARAEMGAIAGRLEAAYPKENKNWTIQLTPWREHVIGNGRPALMVLMGAVAFVLLIACANVANLLLARATSRRREMAIRMAIGASRWQLLQQLLVESLLLALAGGAVGLLLAHWGVKAIVNLLPQFTWTFQALSNARDDLRIDETVLLFTLAISLVTGIIFSLIPARQASQLAIGDWLKEGSRGTQGLRHKRVRDSLVVVEIALAIVLLAGAGLLIQSFARMRQVDLGYDPRGLMTVSLALPRQNGPHFARQAQEKVAATPGVESVSVMSFPTLGGLNFPFNIEGRPISEGDQNASYSAISPNYFDTLKVQMRAGRKFTERDRPETPSVAIINETLARQYFEGEDPIGKRIVISYLGQRKTREIVGVVGDIKQEEPNMPTRPEIFVPFDQQPWFAAWLLIRTTSPDPLALSDDVQRALWSVSNTLPVSKAEAIEDMLDQQVAEPRLYALLLGVFAAIALVLAAVGVYGVTSYSVTERTHEIGVRMALGAERRDILIMVIRQGLMLTIAGVAIGIAAALATGRVLSSLLFEVRASDPPTFISISALLMGVALIASYIPARRATKVDAIVALRNE